MKTYMTLSRRFVLISIPFHDCFIVLLFCVVFVALVHFADASQA